MPFDVSDFPDLPPGERGETRQNRRRIALWLFGLCAMIFVMVVLGGLTRLTGSGLSIMEWAPVTGILPPLDHAQWEHLFALYKQTPQYQLVNDGFGLAGFQRIFWLEWVHRLWGRLLGMAVLVPMGWFWVRGLLPRRLIPRLIGFFVLGGLQGAVGWFMVRSGFFADATAVAPARLVVHLVLALVLYAAILWTGLSALYSAPSAPPSTRGLRRVVAAFTAALALTIAAGGFVAGTHAGFAYNSFPLMSGHLVPRAYAHLHPFWRNLTANIAAVQFDHRVLASLTAVLGLLAAAMALSGGLPWRIRGPVLATAGLVIVQYALGVATLLLVVPVPLAAAHQANAVLTLTASLVALHALRPLPIGQRVRQGLRHGLRRGRPAAALPALPPDAAAADPAAADPAGNGRPGA